MNTTNIISINPISEPSGMHIGKEIFQRGVISAKPVNAMRATLRLILGVTGDTSDSRRRWTFRVILGSILMCFGLLFMHAGVYDVAERIAPGVSVAMVCCGAFIACGLMTRIFSFALAIILTMSLFHLGVMYMAGYSLLVCIGVCVAGVITGSGRYSLDTLIYNMIVKNM